MRSERERASDGCVNTINLLQLGVFKTFPGLFFYKVRPVICVKFEILFPGATFGPKSFSGVNVSHSAKIIIKSCYQMVNNRIKIWFWGIFKKYIGNLFEARFLPFWKKSRILIPNQEGCGEVVHERLNESRVTMKWLLAKPRSFSNLPAFFRY